MGTELLNSQTISVLYDGGPPTKNSLSVNSPGGTRHLLLMSGVCSLTSVMVARVDVDDTDEEERLEPEYRLGWVMDFVFDIVG